MKINLEMKEAWRGAFLINLEKWRTRILRVLSQDAHPRQIAAGLAVGIFIGCTPFYGIQTLIGLGISFIFRLNKPACIAGLWIQNPITMVPLIAISYKLGCMLLGHPPGVFSYQALNWHYLKINLAPFILGSIVTGLLASVPSYFICYSLICTLRKNRILG
jgi:uncharacterized protein